MRTQLLATAIMATVAFPALAAETSAIPAWGTAKAPGSAVRRASAELGSVPAANVFTRASYGTGSAACATASRAVSRSARCRRP